MKRRRKRQEQSNALCKGIAKIAAAVFWVSVCMVDSDTWIPTIVCGVSVGVLIMMQRKFGEDM